ncbi:hypothetical protein [Microscilla marina]|uniref:Uncharacterized protein n=1 Tax=Microscilla marina ATCC 23134 TaxID=313606 RepID=A1ZQ35_MICM2|nr:hypothetical protein [Microscilla marina]EAY27444.1 hypothetical protein M23134_06845 [Microscilla marina ATCC 23134]
MKKKETVFPRLEKIFGVETAQTLPPYIQLAQRMPSNAEENHEIRKNETSDLHQTDFYDVYPLNKPVSKIFDPKVLNNDQS